MTVDEIIEKTIKGKQDEFINRPNKIIREKRRFQLAMAAMQGLLAGDVINEYKTTGMSVEQVTQLAIEHADAMLAELEKKD